MNEIRSFTPRSQPFGIKNQDTKGEMATDNRSGDSSLVGDGNLDETVVYEERSQDSDHGTSDIDMGSGVLPLSPN
jgi:hypothetical protein